MILPTVLTAQDEGTLLNRDAVMVPLWLTTADSTPPARCIARLFTT